MGIIVHEAGLREIGIDGIVGDKRIVVKFNKKIEGWKRTLRELIHDKVILQVEEGEKLLRQKGDMVIYEVFHLDEKLGIACDLTLLRFGKFSPSNSGELFSTYGHLHEKNFGECYICVKNGVFLILVDKNSFATKILKMKEGNAVFIHHKYIHRLTVKNSDAAILGFVLKETGHDYEIVKNKGFPYHIFSKNKGFMFMHNERYEAKQLTLSKPKKISVNPIRLFLNNPEKLKDMLHKPEVYEESYIT